MPNWCITDIYINHENTNKELDRLNKLIEKWTSYNAMNNGFGNCWFSNVVINSGVGTVDKNMSSDLRCRGSIVYQELNGNQLHITTETAWEPMLKMWQKVIDKYLPTAEIVYTAEEPGCGLYVTNDPCYVGQYCVDVWDFPNISPEFCATENYVIEVLQEYLKSNESEINKLLKEFDKANHDGMAIYKWEYSPIEDWD